MMNRRVLHRGMRNDPCCVTLNLVKETSGFYAIMSQPQYISLRRYDFNLADTDKPAFSSNAYNLASC